MRRIGTGTASLNNWTPKRAHSFSMRRVLKIEGLLQEIGYCYGDVDNTVVMECDDVLNHLSAIKEALDESLAEGKML
ncbi:hypothetical protein [Oricola cellulosilytica]|uniref:Uncharacterized protein n=1 Tax=Oricola cellulosilytica TaxID=1429082 RepID=A0A4R0PCH7_9HYPH|nr:hypothetical protein [Oricola cellulosilytica]TCD15172.1 hypothetical protein E0D97_06380 [Oricola cellulosilytica]